MDGGNLKGYAQTVLGAVDVNELGIAMMHEHLLMDLQHNCDEPEDPKERALSRAPVSLENLSWVFLNTTRNKDNMLLSDPELAIREAALFKQAGGGTLVDVTSLGIGRDPIKLRYIAEKTGLHIVMGCSYYHALFHPPEMDEKTEDDIFEEIVGDITRGVDDTGIRAGIIGEVGCNWPLYANEAKVLRASARAQQETGAPISIHPGAHVDSTFEIIEVLAAAGADVERVIMGHMERNVWNHDQMLRLANLGCYIQYDWFGEVRPRFPNGIIEVPSDGERIRNIAFLIAEGFGEKVLVSQDVCFKSRLASFGGPGYAHIAKYVQVWMREMHFEENDIQNLLVNNPRRILEFV